MDIQHYPAMPLATSQIHAVLIQKFETDAELAARELLELAQKLEKAGTLILNSDNKVLCEHLSCEYLVALQVQVQTTLKKYQYACQSQVYVQNVLEYSSK